MQDRYEGHAQGIESPASHGFSITPSDASALAEVTRALYVGSGGALCAVLLSGAELVFPNVPGGTILPLRVAKVKATGTTATGLVGLV